MVCNCGDLGNNNGTCTCRIDRSDRLTCNTLRNDACSFHFAHCNTTLKDSKDGTKFCQYSTIRNKVEQTESAISPLIVENSGKSWSVKSSYKNFRKGLIRSSTSNNLSSNNSSNKKSENKHVETSTQGRPLQSHFTSLKLKMRKLSSRIKKLKKGSKHSHDSTFAIEHGYESSDEFSAETDSSTDETCSPIKRTTSPVNKANSLAENLLPSFPKEKLFRTSQFCPSFELVDLSKPLAPTVIDESDVSFELQLDETTTTSISDCQNSRNNSSFYSKSSLLPFQSSLTSLRINVSFLKEEDSENDIPWTARKDMDGECSENDRRNNCFLKDSKNSKVSQSPISQVTVKPIFYIGSDKSSSTTDESITVPSSNFKNNLSPTHFSPSNSHSTCLIADVNEGENVQLHFSGETRQKLFQAETTKSKNTSLNELNTFAATSIDSPTSSISQELNLTERSFSFSQLPLLFSQQRSSSDRSLTTDLRTVSELSQRGCSMYHNKCFEKENNGKTSISRLVLSDLEEDFKSINIKSTADFSESESISSSEFLLCRYCRSFASCQLTDDSAVPYYSLE